MRLTTGAAPSLPMCGQRIGIIQFFQAVTDGPIRQPSCLRNGRDPPSPQGARFDSCPSPPAALIQVVQEFDIFAFNGFNDSCIMHAAIMT